MSDGMKLFDVCLNGRSEKGREEEEGAGGSRRE